MLMAAVTVFMLLPLSVSAANANCNHYFGGAKWADAVHPHEYFYYCEYGCGEKYYVGSYMTKSNCAICNPSIGNCRHPGGTWTDSAHPHPTVCTSCCEVLSYGTVSGCADCCTYHSGYTFYEEEHQPGGYHYKYLYCYNCGSTIYKGVTYNLSSCEICNPPIVSSVSLYASGPSTTIYSSGIIEATSVPASFTVYADCENCYVTSLYYYDNGRKVKTTGSSISYTASSYDEFQSLTFYVETSTGVTDSISVNFNFARYAEASIKWDYDGIVVRSITQNGRTIRSGLSTTLDMDWNSDLTTSDYNTIASLVGAYDGKTYVLTGSTLIRVYKPSTGQTLATFDTYNEFDALCNYVMWSNQTLNAFESTRVNSLSYQAPMAVEGKAQWVTTDGKVLHTQTAASASGYSYVRPNQSITVTYNASTYMPSGYTLKEMSWDCGSDTGTSTTKTSYSKLYNYTTPPVNATFVLQKLATSGSIKVRALDADTLQIIPTATITCGSKSSTSNPATFSNLPLGTYYPAASAPGYTSASAMLTITGTDANKEIDLLLLKSAGDVTVYVYDSETNKPISGASITGTASGTTNSNGYCVFKNITFGSNLPFYASATGYNSGSGTATLSKAQQSDTVVIYLDPIPKTGDIDVTVVDSVTGYAISGAYVSGCGQYGYTDYYGGITFYDVLYGGYTISASASGYYSGSGYASTSKSYPNDSVTIYLDPIPTTGDITVKVVDSETGSVISGASVSGANRSGTTNSSGYAYFYDVPFGSYTFTASKSGYYSGTGSASISLSDMTDSITIYLEPIPTEGDITVRVVDSETGNAISGASVSGASRSGSTNSSGYAYFYDVPFGSYTFTASKSGYYSGSSNATISLSDMTDSITIYLDPIPTEGDITVKVVDSGTGRVISCASVSGASRSGTTNSSGLAYFYDVPFGSYTFTASATGYYSNTGTASISLSDMTDTITIYLDLIPTSGDITVYVKDKDTGSAISGASVSGGGRSGTTNSSGYIKFTELDFGSYTFTASAEGYVSGTGSASISVTATDKTITIYLEEKRTDLSPDAIVNGDIYKGSTIIVSAEVNNDGDIDLIPGKAATVTMTAKRNGGSVFDTQTKTVIIPANASNLVWFTVDMPKDGYTSSTVTFEFKVSAPSGVKETSVSNNTDTISKTVVDLPNRNCVDADMELNAPSSFSYSKYSSNSATTRTWSVYEWNGGFVRKTYTAKLVMSAALVPDATAGYRKQSGGIWTTRSSYGLNTEVSVSVSGGGSDIAGTLKVDSFYPEHNYSTATNKSDRLELVGGKYVFKSNGNTVSGSRMHTTPLWFPDKAYAVKYYAFDLWCPGGMLYGYTNAYVNIDGDMYDDLYTN